MNIIKKSFEKIGILHAFEQGLIARILVVLAIFYALFGLIFVPVRIIMAVVPSLPAPHWSDVVIESFILIDSIIALLLIRAHKMRTAGLVILAGIFCMVTLQTYLLGGPANDLSGSMGLLLFALLAILLLDRAQRWIAVGLAVAAFVIMMGLAATDNLPIIRVLTPEGKIIYTIFAWVAMGIVIAFLLITTMGAIRRETYLIDQQFTAPKASEENVTFLSTHDSLTGLFNRLFFETEFTRLEKSRTFPITVISVEIGDLQAINKKHGNKTGDEVILNSARILTAALRPEDIVSRYGGDEFAVLLPSVDAATAEVIINRVREQLAAYNAAHAKLPIRVSVGASTASKGESLRGHLTKAKKHLVPLLT